MFKMFLAKFFTVVIGFGPSIGYGKYWLNHTHDPVAIIAMIMSMGWLGMINYRHGPNTDHA